MSETQDKIITNRHGACGIITLNRPEALNALTLDMVEGIADALEAWRDDVRVTHILIEGAGERAFCAGGDIKAAYRVGKAVLDGEMPREEMVHFFRREYGVNKALFHYPKPVISLIHGITMGGGYGLAGNGRYQVACENTVFAMPETAIGFFTDVGSVYHMQRCPGALGRYLAVTGERLKGVAVYEAGLSSHYVPHERWGVMRNAIIELGVDALAKFHDPPHAGILEGLLAEVNPVFDKARSMPDVFAALEVQGGEWARAILKTLGARSPTSIYVCDEHYARAAVDSDFDTVIARDFALVQAFMSGSDFYEGVRALLIDKDNAPQWEFASIQDVQDTRIQALFEHASDKL
jgi:enoyl-CoA hydratase